MKIVTLRILKAPRLFVGQCEGLSVGFIQAKIVLWMPRLFVGQCEGLSAGFM